MINFFCPAGIPATIQQWQVCVINLLSYSFISTKIYNSVHHTCEYDQLQNRSNHFDTPCICVYIYIYIYIYTHTQTERETETEHCVACMMQVTITIHSASYLMWQHCSYLMWQHWFKTAWEVSEFVALLMYLDSFTIVLNFRIHSIWTLLHRVFNRFTCLSL